MDGCGISYRIVCKATMHIQQSTNSCHPTKCVATIEKSTEQLMNHCTKLTKLST